MRLILTALLVFGTSLLHAQVATIRGSVKDTTGNSIPTNTVISVLRIKDSTLVAFTRSNAQGTFELNHLPTGNFILWITHPLYGTYSDSLTFHEGQNNLPTIPLTLRTKLLKEIVINGVSAIRMKGDTLEYKADSFAVRPNASVEELLKKLPGIQVDKNGKITAQGETVKKVLVDGEEFFSDDPTVATKNLPANAVDKVQVFDKQSDEAAFTGIEDGSKNKTINLKLKEEKKNGYFGKAAAGGGSDGYYENSAAINFFKKNRKFSVFGTLANTGKTGLNWMDKSNYTGGMNPEMDEDGSMYFFSSGSDFYGWGGTYSGAGIPKAWNAGTHYSNKLGDKQKVNGNYEFNQIDFEALNKTNSRYLLSDSSYNASTDVSRSTTHDLQHTADASYEVAPDSSSSLKVTLKGKSRHGSTSSESTSQTSSDLGKMINNSQRNTSAVLDNNSFNSTALWRKKFKKKGRSMTLNLEEEYQEGTSKGFLYSIINGYTNDLISSRDTTDQFKNTLSKSLRLYGKMTYTEPLGHNNFLTFSYGLSHTGNTSNKDSYDKSHDNKYDVLDTTYSNRYQFDVLTNTGGLFFKKSTKKYNYSLGTDIGATSYRQDNIYHDTVSKRNFINWFPKANFNYRFTSQRRLQISYDGRTDQPSLDQLQPVATNNDPLNIAIGNASLKPSFQHSFNSFFSDYKVMTERSIWINMSYSITNNSISSRDSVTSEGKRYYQAVNINGNKSFYADVSNNYKIKKLDMRGGVNLNYNWHRNVNYVNSQLNSTNSNDISLGFSLEKSKDKVYSASLRANAHYNTSTSSIQQSNNTRYWTYDGTATFTKDLPWKMLFSVDCNADIRQKTNLFESRNVFICNSSLTKRFLKSEGLELKLSINDLFNQNIGYNRSVSTNNIVESSYNTIQRYFLATLSWNFSKNGKPLAIF